MADDGERKEAARSLVGGLMAALGRFAVPVALLLAVLIASFELRATYVTMLDVFGREQWYLNPGYWLTFGDVTLPASFLVLNLVNRRSGPAFALSTVVISWLAIGAAGLWLVSQEGVAWVDDEIGAWPVLAVFVGSYFAGQIICIYVFDRVRGIPWWRAPLFGTMLGGLVYVALRYSQIGPELGVPWHNRVVVESGIQVAWAFAGVYFYHLMRRRVRPLPGFGGA